MCRSKKGDITIESIISIALICLAFILIATIIYKTAGKAEALGEETTCRSSVVLSEKASKETFIGKAKTNLFLCHTIKAEVEPTSEESAKREIADLMARTWWMMGEGYVTDPLRGGAIGSNNACFQSYRVITIKTDGFKEKIPAEEMYNYLYETPYQVQITGFEYNCANNVDDDNDDKKDYADEDCQPPKTLTQCGRNGGTCASMCGSTQKEYLAFSCNAGEVCCVPSESMVTYMNYLQQNNGKIGILTDIEPGHEYAILFGAPSSGKVEWMASGAVGGAVIGGVIAASVGLPVTIVAAGVAAVATAGSSMAADKLFEIISQREGFMIYITQLDEQITEICPVIQK